MHAFGSLRPYTKPKSLHPELQRPAHKRFGRNEIVFSLEAEGRVGPNTRACYTGWYWYRAIKTYSITAHCLGAGFSPLPQMSHLRIMQVGFTCVHVVGSIIKFSYVGKVSGPKCLSNQILAYALWASRLSGLLFLPTTTISEFSLALGFELIATTKFG